MKLIVSTFLVNKVKKCLLKSGKVNKLQTINCNQLSPCGPIPHYHLARALMPRQPYSEAVKSDVSVPYKGNRRGRKDY